MRWLPVARSINWWKLGGITFILATLLLWFMRFVVVGQTFTYLHAFRFLLLAAVIVLLTTLAGWLGARWVWLASTAGMLAGLLFMLPYATGDRSGWDDLASLLAFLQAVILGMLAGIAIELGAWGLRFWQARSKKSS